MSEETLELRAVERIFQSGGTELPILRGVDLVVRAGEIVAQDGPSGAGKSTLLQIAGLLEPPDEGEVLIAGRSCARADDAERTGIRRDTVGFVYQYHHLLPEFSALENVMMPQRIAGTPRRAAAARAIDLLERLGLAARADHRPARLSGGEQQRVAIARALANQPRLLLADEPTGNLDGRTADGVFAELMGLVRETGVAALIATHNRVLARQMDRTVGLDDGRLVTG